MDDVKTLLIVRAADADPEGAHLDVRVQFERPPNGEELQRFKIHARAAFREAFEREPARFGVALLPYVEADELD